MPSTSIAADAAALKRSSLLSSLHCSCMASTQNTTISSPSPQHLTSGRTSNDSISPVMVGRSISRVSQSMVSVSCSLLLLLLVLRPCDALAVSDNSRNSQAPSDAHASRLDPEPWQNRQQLPGSHRHQQSFLRRLQRQQQHHQQWPHDSTEQRQTQLPVALQETLLPGQFEELEQSNMQQSWRRSMLNNQKPPQKPPYNRAGGSQYQFWVPKKNRLDGIAYIGSAERLRVALDRLHKGGTLKFASIGGSITAGQGAADGIAWPLYVDNYLIDTYGSDKVTHQWSAVGGTTSAYMSVCHNMHVPKDADLLFVEYSVNDDPVPRFHNGTTKPLFRNPQRQLFERLLRKLMQYPKAPAVVLVHAYSWRSHHHGTYWSNAEREFSELASYYNLPSVSVKAAAYHLMKAGVEGYQVDAARADDEDAYKGLKFYHDDIHPDGNTGARVFGEIAITLLQQVINGTVLDPVTPEEAASAAQPIPEPMIRGNQESVQDKCFIGLLFTGTVQSKDGDWDWINESKTDRPKWGFVAKTPGSVLNLNLDTTASTGGGGEVLIQLAYLQSYENMGKASVACTKGCSCNESVIQGHTPEHNSLLHLHDFYVSQSTSCIVTITVLEESMSPGNGHKVKVAGVMISEEAGHGHEGIRNSGAVEYVHDISSRQKSGQALFDQRNHA